MTVAELLDAIEGNNEAENAKTEIFLWGIRRVIFHQINIWKKIKEEDIFSLKMDEELKANRYKNMPLMTVKKDE